MLYGRFVLCMSRDGSITLLGECMNRVGRRYRTFNPDGSNPTRGFESHCTHHYSSALGPAINNEKETFIMACVPELQKSDH